RPVVWIELGGGLNRLDESQKRVAPPFFTSVVNAGFSSPLALERPPLYSLDENGKISFQPEDSDWVFSISVRYGRSDNDAYRHQQTNNLIGNFNNEFPSQARHRYAEITASNSETHDILDFMAGKDFGLGMFGKGGTSVLSGGIRFAQFRSKSGLSAYADPDYTDPNVTSIVGPKYLHNYSAKANNKTSFTGVGPSISWDASAPLIGQTQNGEITLDWSLNGAVLFGRQKSVGSHQTKGKLSTGLASDPAQGKYFNTKHYTQGFPHNRSRMVAVPNVGGTAGLSFRYANAKVSFGYRADMFFGAMDGGIDTAKKENVGFYGPFASVSVGLGG
ncbi:MAG TPA: Lpg1974 family pore-forming outer membrane protein, partial [Rhizomicrobium sp.]